MCALEHTAPRQLLERPGAAHGHAAEAHTAAFEQHLTAVRTAVERAETHHAADGAASEQRTLRTAHHFHSLDADGGQMRPIETAAECIQRKAVDHDVRVVGFAASR